MYRLKAILPICILCSVIILAACAERRAMIVHPAAEDIGLGKQPPVCVGCHESSDGTINYAQFNHTALFADNHRTQAQRSADVCAMCHQASYCQTCHGAGNELKASEFSPADTFRRSPHRGDYLTRHRIDGRIDPTSCFRCHGNPKASSSCVRCHG